MKLRRRAAGHWKCDGNATVDAYDFTGFTLLLADGTEYTILRENLDNHSYISGAFDVQAWGKPYVSEIKQKAGDRIVIDAGGVHSYAAGAGSPRKSVKIERKNGRITTIYDPNRPTDVPVLIYDYDSQGNLEAVRRRLRNNGANAEYLVTQYFYEDARRPNLLTSIIDSRGKRIAANTYDAKGRLASTMNAARITTAQDYNTEVTPNEKTLTQDRIKGKIMTTVAGQSQVTGYDAEGNVIYTMDIRGGETVFAYDDHGFMTSETKLTSAGNFVTTHAPTYAFTPEQIEYLQQLVTIEPPAAGELETDFTTTQVFEPSGDLKQVTRPSGGMEIREYDLGRLKAIRNKVGGDELMKWTYRSSQEPDEKEETLIGKIATTTPPTPVYQTMKFNSDNLYSTPGTTTLNDGLGTTMTGTYDANLRLTSLSVHGQNSTTVLDDLGRETSATYNFGLLAPGLPDNLTVDYQHEGELDWNHVSAPTIGTLDRSFDDAGRLQGWQLADGSQPSFGYDDLGRLKSEIDASGARTTHSYSGLQKITKRPGEPEVTTRTDERGLVMEESSRAGRVVLDYYPDGRLKSRSQSQISGMASHIPGGGGGVLHPGDAQYGYAYPIRLSGGAADGSAIVVTDPLQRVSTSELTREGLLKSVSGNACCGSTAFTYLLDDPMLEAEDFPLTITDAGGRVRTFTYFLTSETIGSIGQLQTATDLAGKTYSFQYFKPDASPAFSGALKQVISPQVPIRNQGLVQETLLEYTYDNQQREKTVHYAGLSTDKVYTYGTIALGATHLPSRISLPNGGAMELRYEDNTGRVKDRYLKRASQTDANADQKSTFTYEPGDKLDRIDYWTPVSSSPQQVIDYQYGRIVTADPPNQRFLAPYHTLQAGDPVRFSSTGTLPAGLSAGTTYYVLNAVGGMSGSFQIATTPNPSAPGGSTPVAPANLGEGIHTVSDGSAWAVIARREINGSTPTHRSELIRRQRFYETEYMGRIEEIGVRAKPNAPTYVSEYNYNNAGQLEVLNVYKESGTSRERKYRFEFQRDKAGRLELRGAFLADNPDPNVLVPVLTSNYEYYKNGQNPANGDFVESIEHKGYPSGNVLEKVSYVRGSVGEPTHITWPGEASVDIGYTTGQGLRIASEDFSSGTDNSYAYADNGSRLQTKTGEIYVYDPGFKLYEITDPPNAVRSYAFDNGGNLVSAPGLAMTYTVDDRLKTVTKDSAMTAYEYDPQGSRVRAVKGSTERRFVRGPGSGTDLELLHMITDQNDNVKAVYIYAGAQPLMRFEVDANGNPANPVFYMEDAMGSVLGLINTSGNRIAHFRYDGFGNSRSEFDVPASTDDMPPGADGDFRYHGAWLESHSGLYHMRARDYDPATGRFVERDPVEGSLKVPETFHAYAFANGNPYLYADPSGEFTVIEINLTGALQGTLQGLRTAAVARGRNKIFDVIGSVVKDQVVKQVRNLLPTDDFLASFKDGVKLGTILRRTICGSLHVPDNMYFEVPITTDGRPLGNGFSCQEDIDPKEVLRLAGLAVPRPDFVIGPRSPHGAGSFPKSWLIGEIKASTSGLYAEFIKPGHNLDQFWAILNYARKHTYSRTALFLTGIRGNKPPSDLLLIEEIGKSALSKGVLPVVVRIVD